MLFCVEPVLYATVVCSIALVQALAINLLANN